MTHKDNQLTRLWRQVLLQAFRDFNQYIKNKDHYDAVDNCPIRKKKRTELDREIINAMRWLCGEFDYHGFSEVVDHADFGFSPECVSSYAKKQRAAGLPVCVEGSNTMGRASLMPRKATKRRAPRKQKDLFGDE